MDKNKKQIEKIGGIVICICVIVIPFFLGLLFDDTIIGIIFGIIGGLILTIFAIIGDGRGFIFGFPFAYFALGGFAYLCGGIGGGIGDIYRDGNMIKGNIQYETYEKIYHIPGCSHYEDTEIETLDGEKRFSSELEAKEAGWRKCNDY